MLDNQMLLDRLDSLERQVAALMEERDTARRLEAEEELAWDLAFPALTASAR